MAITVLHVASTFQLGVAVTATESCQIIDF